MLQKIIEMIEDAYPEKSTKTLGDSLLTKTYEFRFNQKDKELKSVQEAYQEKLKDRDRQISLLTSEATLLKSRLLYFERHLDRAMDALVG